MLSAGIDKYIKKTFGLNTSEGYVADRINEGYSGAEVYLLRILRAKRGRDNGIYILKVIDTLGQWYDPANNEEMKSRAFYRNAGEFSKHLVKVSSSSSVDDKLVLILAYANNSQLTTMSLLQERLDKKLRLVRKISFDLLAGMNAQTNLTQTCDMLERWCSYRIEPDGNFVKRMRMYICSPNRPALNINGVILPNPLGYVDRLQSMVENKYFQFVTGIVHGDLYQKNILIPRNMEGDRNINVQQMDDRYVIIDYDTITENTYLLFDHAYLELNLYMEELRMCDLERWMQSLQYTFRIEDIEIDTVEFAEIRGIECSIRNGIEEWCESKYPGLRDSIHVQLQLARIAAGINYFSKGGIDSRTEHLKYLMYIAYGLKEFFNLIGYKWDHENTSRLVNREEETLNVDVLWNECGRMRNDHIKVLITDDGYDIHEYETLSAIGEIDWKLIVDVGKNGAPDDLVTALIPEIKKHNGIKFIDSEDLLSIPRDGVTSILSVKRGRAMPAFGHWTAFRKKFIPVIKTICGNELFKPVLFIMDFHDDSLIHDKFIEMLWEESLIRKASRFVCFGRKHEIALQREELEEREIQYFEHENMELGDMVKLIDAYGLRRQKISDEIILPSIDSMDGKLSQEDWNSYNPVVEIVYSGMEQKQSDYSDGEDFYKGNEITWLDLAQNKDIKWRRYEQWKKTIMEKLKTERVAVCSLIHGAGTGGTTLSKRLMWDIKDIYPTLRIRKYDPDVANVIIDIYGKKTGKCVFAVAEMGSSVLSEEELEMIKERVNANSCRAVFLKVERATSAKGKGEIFLGEELIGNDAENFYTKYLPMAGDSQEKKRCLKGITYDSRMDIWRGQCCPFFYGFYTFQEEYRGIEHFLSASIRQCDEDIKGILGDLSIITKYSQNICMPYTEMTKRLGLDETNLVMIFSKFDSGIEKILAQRENGFRICHPLIAQKLLDLIFDDYRSDCARLYAATMMFIDHMHSIYEEMDREYLDKIFKELFIDRAYIDGEQNKFAELITCLETQVNKINVFEKLITLYKDNPYYYNHLGRLEISDKNNMQFDQAVADLKRALDIARANNLGMESHYTTLGCIYSERVKFDMQERMSIERLLDTISADFANASECFREARQNKKNSTYAYFPNILMICSVVNKMTDIQKRSVQELLKNKRFEEWYNYNAGIAIQLFEQMKRNCADELSDSLESKAENCIKALEGNVEALKGKLLSRRNSGMGVREENHLGRTVSMLLYRQNHYKWQGMEKDNLLFAERELDRILSSRDYNQSDVIMWFHVYRQIDKFDIGHAKRYLLEYMEEGYYKNYLLWLLCFVEYERGILPYKEVEKRQIACRYNWQLEENHIRTTRNIDVYTNDENGFPIKRVMRKDGEQEDVGDLRKFTGRIIEIEGTAKGKIQLEGDLSDVIAMFVPSFSVGDERREFKRENISDRVEFNLFFTYSGYKAQDPKKI